MVHDHHLRLRRGVWRLLRDLMGGLVSLYKLGNAILFDSVVFSSCRNRKTFVRCCRNILV
jgi:hypothetical protein